MKTSEAVYKAAEYMAENGQYKGYFYDESSEEHEDVRTCKQAGELKMPMCMMGAVNWASWEENTLNTTSTEVAVFERGREVLSGRTIPEFNDDENTTTEDAILALKQIGHSFEEEGD